MDFSGRDVRGALIIAALIVQQSEAFSNCIHNRKNNKEYEALHKGTGMVGFSIIRTRFRLNYVCAWAFTDKNNGAIIALATIALSAFTATLWHATRGLWELGRLQQADMQGLLAAARDNAAAAPQPKP
jgi:hypothetical protein